MNRVNRLLVLAQIALLMLLPAARDCAGAQTAAPAADPAITNLTVRLTEALHKAKRKRVILLDLRGPQGEAHPVGKWLADHLSAALRTGAPELQVLDRSQIESQTNAQEAPASGDAPDKRAVELARSAGADAVVTGSFAKAAEVLGISLSVMKPGRSGQLLGQVTGTVPITEEITALSPNPIPTFKEGVAKAGVGGITNPKCIYCPDPEYSSEARRANYQGTVALSVLVNAEGHVEKVLVISSPGLGLEEKAIEAVATEARRGCEWKTCVGHYFRRDYVSHVYVIPGSASRRINPTYDELQLWCRVEWERNARRDGIDEGSGAAQAGEGAPM